MEKKKKKGVRMYQVLFHKHQRKNETFVKDKKIYFGRHD